MQQRQWRSSRTCKKDSVNSTVYQPLKALRPLPSVLSAFYEDCVSQAKRDTLLGVPREGGDKVLKSGWVNTPSLRPSPPQGGEGLSVLGPLPVGEGWVRAFLVFLKQNPLPRLRRYFPQRGKIWGRQIFPLWGKWRVAPKGALFSVYRVPREGGDPDPFTQTGNGPLDPNFRWYAADRAWMTPSPHPLPLKGARARTDRPSP